MTIAFIHRGTAILPEIAAYRTYFEAIGYTVIECGPDAVATQKPDIEWHFLGMHRRRQQPGGLVIHEYASLSAAPFAKGKDRLKRALNTQPDYRIFLNEFTRTGLNFRDEVPWGIRSTIFLPGKNIANPVKKYDFVYAGTLEKSREPEKWLNWFLPGGPLENKQLLVLAPKREELEKKYNYPWIRFHGKVRPEEVHELLQEARFGINYQPDKSPFNQQPSSKFLAYAAAGIGIISTRYEWVQEFRERYGGAYYMVETRAPEISFTDIEQFPYEQPDLREWTMEYQLERSGILAFLKQQGYYPEIRITAQ